MSHWSVILGVPAQWRRVVRLLDNNTMLNFLLLFFAAASSRATRLPRELASWPGNESTAPAHATAYELPQAALQHHVDGHWNGTQDIAADHTVYSVYSTYTPLNQVPLYGPQLLPPTLYHHPPRVGQSP